MEDASPEQPLTGKGADQAPETAGGTGGEERVDRHPCDEGDKSFFYSLHCGRTKRRCPHCNQWVCPYHFEPNGEGVVGGHSNCAGASRSHAREGSTQSRPSLESSPEVPKADADAEEGQGLVSQERRSSSFTRGLSYIFEGLGVLLVLSFVGGIGYILHRHQSHRHTVAHAAGQEEVHWSWSSVLWCILAALIVVTCGGPSLLFCVGQIRQAANKGIMPRLCPDFVNVGSATTEEAMPRFLASESVLGGLVTLVGVVLGLCFVRDGGAPLWLLPLCLPVVIRSKIVEVRLLPFYGGGFSIFSDIMPCFLSALEVFDRYSDGITLAVMHAGKEKIETRWVNTFWRNPSPVVQSMAPLFSVVFLWHISAVALLISVAQQLVIGMDTKGLRKLPSFGEEELNVPGYGPEAPQAAIGADIAGFGALAGRFEKRSAADGRRGIVKVALGFAKSLTENMPQGLLATVHLSLQGQSLTGHPVVLASAVVSTLSLAKQGVSVLQGTFSISRAAYAEDPGSGLVIFSLVFPMGLLILVCSAYLATKLVMIELCPEHAWNVSVGCIDLAEFD